jgi:hypothetical protein|tara:strand:- start:1488 stop:1628 length:141 start_codon:yes stop_codon:yes gene_type:complete
MKYQRNVAAALPRLKSLDTIAITKEDRAREDVYAKARETRMREDEG